MVDVCDGYLAAEVSRIAMPCCQTSVQQSTLGTGCPMQTISCTWRPVVPIREDPAAHGHWCTLQTSTIAYPLNGVSGHTPCTCRYIALGEIAIQDSTLCATLIHRKICEVPSTHATCFCVSRLARTMKVLIVMHGRAKLRCRCLPGRYSTRWSPACHNRSLIGKAFRQNTHRCTAAMTRATVKQTAVATCRRIYNTHPTPTRASFTCSCHLSHL